MCIFKDFVLNDRKRMVFANVNKKPFGSGTNCLSKWGKILLFFHLKIGSVKHKRPY